MEEVIDPKDYPSAPLVKCPRAPIGEGEIAALVSNLQNEPIFRGVWTLDEKGDPVAILHALDEKTFRAARLNIAGVLAWNWNHHFGRLLSFTLVVRGERSPRMFVSDDSALVRAVADRGRVSFAVSQGKKLSPFYLADFTKHPSNPDMLGAFRAVLSFPDAKNFVFRDDELAYWLLMSDSKMRWAADLPTRDAMRASWARCYEVQVKILVDALSDIRRGGPVEKPYVNDDAEANVPVVMGFFDEIVRAIILPATRTHTLLGLVCNAFSDSKKMGDLVGGVLTSFRKEVLVDSLKWVVRELLWAAILSPSATGSGLRRPWLDGRSGSGDVTVKYIDLDPTVFGEDARHYWTDFEFSELFDLGYVVSGKDMPIPRIQLYRELADLKLDCTEVEADDAIRELLAEAREGRRWTVPWGARVQVDIGSLKYLDIYELEGEFLGLLRDSHERFMMIPVNVTTERYSPPMILRADKDQKNVEENTHAALALVLIVASVVRDFLVVEERQSQFVARPAKRSRCPTNQALSTIYLPRVHYLKADVGTFHKAIAGDIHRTAHDVAAHLRKAEKASAEQVLLAMRYGYSVPRGYTFVRPHRRGDAVAQERQRLYRSRSASAILYRTLEQAPIGSRPAWFDFEKDVATALSRMALRVVHQAASRSGDGGVDIYAHDETKDRVWAIQCKCYAPARKVGPNVVRELAGSLHRYPAETCGMIVTTSSFTPAAIEEAAALNIRTIDGVQFAALAKGVLAPGRQ